MSTTTVRLPDDVKTRVASLARQAGVSAHNYIVQAVEQQMLRDEARADFVREARERLDEMDRGGEGAPWDDVRTWLLARAAGRPAARPGAHPPARKTVRKPASKTSAKPKPARR
jgi:predicted transcriptional regulator